MLQSKNNLFINLLQRKIMTNPICPYFGRCGGCLYQDLTPEDYLNKKKNFILNAFKANGLTPALEDVRTVPLGTRRRATFAFYKGHLGFNELKSHRIVDINTCQLLTPALTAFLPALTALARDLRGTGDIAVLDTPYGIDMHIKTGKERPSLPQLEMLAVFAGNQPVARLLFNNEPVLQKVSLPFPPDVFLQPSETGEKILISLMLEGIGEAQRVADLFCGAGTFTRPLLERGIKVTGYDNDPRTVSTLKEHGIVRDLFRNPLLPTELDGLDGVVIDPPRAGAKAQTEQLAQTNIPTIVMISCNPTTAARDCAILTENGYKISKITPVDQFTFSNHVELVCVLKR